MKRSLLRRITAICVLSAMLLGTFGTAGILAADEGTVLFSDNFSGLTVGAKVTVDAKDASKWNGKAESATALLLGYDDGGNMALRISNDAGEKVGGPRLEKKLDVSGLKDLTVSYRTKTKGCSALLQLWSDGAANKSILSYDGSVWATLKVVMNLEKKTYTTYIDGKEKDKNQTFNTISDPSTFTLRFTQQVDPGDEVFLDDIVISTSGAVSAGTATATPKPAASSAPVADTGDAPKSITPPAGATVLMNETHESITDSAVKTGGTTWTRMVKSETALVTVATVSGNKVVKFSNTGDATGYPRLEKSLGYKGLSKFTIQYAVKAMGNNAYLELYADGAKNAALASVTTSGSVWDYVRVEVDLAKKTASSYLNDKELNKNIALKDITDANSLTLRFNNAVKPGTATYLDNVVISTTDAVEVNNILAGDGKVNFDKVKVNTDTPLVPSLRAHPRLFINSFDPIKEKINADYAYKSWYTGVKAAADSYLNIGPPEYSRAIRDNILNQSRAVMQRVYVLSFVYNIEKDKKYLDRAIKELEAASAYPDWTPNEFLATAEMMNAFAIGYDWLYYDLTQEQKDFLMSTMMEKGIGPTIYNYEGEPQGTNWAKSTINWNPVCNGGAVIAALGMISDQHPDVAEYLLEKASASIPNGLKPYAPDGAYPEGTGYWTYGTKYLVYIMATLDSAFKDGVTLPDKFIFYNKPGIADTAQYPIYYNGPVGAFNFGDADSGRSSSSIMYWFAEKFNKPQYAWYQKNAEFELDKDLAGMEGVFAIIWYDYKNAQLTPGAFGLDKAYDTKDKHNGVVLRSSWENPNAIYAGMQGGLNTDNHMFLSLGTFVLEANGKRWINTAGRGDYNYPNYFSKSAADSARWTYYVARAEAQNTIVANPTNLADQAVNAKAQVIAFESAENEAFGVLDMTQTNAAFTDAKRGMYLTDNRSKLIIQDEIKTNKPSEIWWFANTGADITIAPDGKSAMLTLGTGTNEEKKMWVNIAGGPAEAKLMVMDCVPLPTSPNPAVQTINTGHKLAIHLQDVSELNLSVEFIPLAEGEAPPAAKSVVTPIKDWKAEKAEPALPLKVGDVVSLMLNSPTAFAKGEKTYVDPNNLEVQAIERDGRTLVPVRFIAEKFGATVGWEEEAKTATVEYQDKTIKLQIDNNVMTVNGQETILDVPAQQINDRTLIPLRAMVESLGKQVFWDDRGLIIISNEKTAFDGATIDSLIALLDYRITVDGKDLEFFDPERTVYDISLPQSAAAPVIAFSANESDVSATVEQAASVSGTAKVTVNKGGKQIVYTLNFGKDAFEGLPGTASADIPKTLRLALADEAGIPKEPTWIEVKDVTMSAGESYGKTGTIDNVINNNTANRWSAEGDAWIGYDLGQETSVYAMGLATMSGDKRKSRFDIEISNDGQSWTKVFSGETSGTTSLPEIFTLKDVKTRYIRIFGHGNSANQWNSYTEVRFYKDAAQLQADKDNWSKYFNSGSITAKVGATTKIKTVGVNAAGQDIALPADAQITYQSSDPKVVTVDAQGNVKITGVGTAKIIVTVVFGSTRKSATMPVTGQ